VLPATFDTTEALFPAAPTESGESTAFVATLLSRHCESYGLERSLSATGFHPVSGRMISLLCVLANIDDALLKGQEQLAHRINTSELNFSLGRFPSNAA
jgi:hypothetical protein